MGSTNQIHSIFSILQERICAQTALRGRNFSIVTQRVTSSEWFTAEDKNRVNKFRMTEFICTRQKLELITNRKILI